MKNYYYLSMPDDSIRKIEFSYWKLKQSNNTSDNLPDKYILYEDMIFNIFFFIKRKTKHYKKKNGLIGIECYIENDPYIVDAIKRVKLACLLIFDELVKPLIESNKVNLFSDDTGFTQVDNAIVNNLINHMESFLLHVEDSLKELKQ